MATVDVQGVEIHGPVEGRAAEVLTPEAVDFVATLQRKFDPVRQELLRARAERQERFDAGEMLDFLPETREVREGDWRVAPVPDSLARRWVEITGPTDRKMTINALNSGADGWLADQEDATSPTWANVVGGQVNLKDAIEGTIEFENPDGSVRRLDGPLEQLPRILMRPRGWHLPEKHLTVDGQQAAGSLVDFGLFFFHNARALLERGLGPFFYLPKLQSHREARLWNEVFTFAQDALDVPQGSVKATVLIETFPAAFEMEEILYELRDHSAGLNAGRWDYLFSATKTFRNRPEFLMPDRTDLKMTVPFMRAYTELLVKTCHRRGAHAMGGMSAFIPSRKTPEINEKALEQVAGDKKREAADGYDGTWIAHPDLVNTARREFAAVIGERPNQIDRRREDVEVSAADLLDVASTPGSQTEAGLRMNCNVGIQYISSWLRGNGAAPIFNLMEDAATAEISRSQVWQWIHHGVTLAEGEKVTPDLVRRIEDEELAKIREQVGDEFYAQSRADESKALFEQVALSGEEFVEFLTLPAYEHID
jgi:malate synthase